MGTKTAFRLQELQDQFVTNLKAKIPSPDFLDQFQSDTLSAMTRFSLYRSNWRIGALKALTRVYPVCQRLVGERYFQMMTHDYIDQYPSVSPTLYEYGAFLAEYLVDTPFVRDLPYLPDVARLEWAIHSVLLGPESSVFNWQALSEISSDQQTHVCFHQRQNSVLYHAPFPIDRIWETNQIDFTGDDRVDLDEGEIYLFIYRSGYELRMDRLNTFQWSLLNLLDGNRSLGQLPTLLGEKRSKQILGELPILIKKGYLTNFNL